MLIKPTLIFAMTIVTERIYKTITTFCRRNSKLGVIGKVVQAIYKPARANQKVIHFRSEAIIISSPSHFVLYAKELLSAIAEGDMLRTYLTALRRLIKHIPINTISLRRKIADHLIEMERYAL